MMKIRKLTLQKSIKKITSTKLQNRSNLIPSKRKAWCGLNRATKKSFLASLGLSKKPFTPFFLESTFLSLDRYEVKVEC